MTTTKLATLRQKLAAIENQIAEIRNRLPAHSTKPSMMMELLTLEDERDELRSQIDSLSKKRCSPEL